MQQDWLARWNNSRRLGLVGPGWVSRAAGPAQWHHRLARRHLAGAHADDQHHRRAAGLSELAGEDGMALAGSSEPVGVATLPWLLSERGGSGMVGAHQVELAVAPPQPPQTAWQQLAEQQHTVWEAEEAKAELERILAGGYAGRSQADWRRWVVIEKITADAHQRHQKDVFCEGLLGQRTGWRQDEHDQQPRWGMSGARGAVGARGGGRGARGRRADGELGVARQGGLLVTLLHFVLH